MEQALDEWWGAVSTVIKAEMLAHKPRLSQADLASQVGIGRESMNNYLSGKREMPLPIFYKIAAALDLTPQWLLDEADRRLARGR